RPMPSTAEGYVPSSLYIRYLPRSKRRSKWEVVIEFSVTKLLLGNNVAELPPTGVAGHLATMLTALLEQAGIKVDFDR
ncbi:hypothetical protein ACSTKA_23270, partial [Vibrio parahaemolyticus]